jgi:BMFP domain-containing protein YqiC
VSIGGSARLLVVGSAVLAVCSAVLGEGRVSTKKIPACGIYLGGQRRGMLVLVMRSCNSEVSQGKESVVRAQELEGLNRLGLLSREEGSVVRSQGGEVGWFNSEVSQGKESVVRAQEVEGLNRLGLLSREEGSVVRSQLGEVTSVTGTVTEDDASIEHRGASGRVVGLTGAAGGPVSKKCRLSRFQQDAAVIRPAGPKVIVDPGVVEDSAPYQVDGCGRGLSSLSSGCPEGQRNCCNRRCLFFAKGATIC